MNTEYILEINAARGCTNACDSCNHASTRFTEPWFMPVEAVANDLVKLSALLRVRMLMVQGGEPLLHPKVEDLVRLAHAAGMSAQVGVLTNGKLLYRIQEAFFVTMGECQAELRISVYPDLDTKMVSYAMEMGWRYGFTVAAHTINRFKPLFRLNDGSSYYACPWKRCLTVHLGHLYLCPISCFFPKTYMHLPETIDGLALDGLTEERLRMFLDRQEPLHSCRICAGAQGPDIPWSQSKSEAQWAERAGLTLCT